MAKQKFYVVWEGVTPGIYSSWTDCQLQIKGYEGAKYKSFDSREEAERALASSPYAYIGKNATNKKENKPTLHTLPAAVIENSLAVDAACSGNPGPMEYRGEYQNIAHKGRQHHQKQHKKGDPCAPPAQQELNMCPCRANKHCGHPLLLYGYIA